MGSADVAGAPDVQPENERDGGRAYALEFTLLNPPKKYEHLKGIQRYEHLKGIQRIGQTADHMGMGEAATLARRRRQYEEKRNTSVISMRPQ